MKIIKHQLMALLCLFTAFDVCAQNKLDSLPAFLSSEPVNENIHLHLDKDVYLPGETIWFKAYILAEGKLTDVSKNLFTELWDRNGNLLYKFTSPIIAGTSAGQFTLPDSGINGQLIIRSFTKNMLANENAKLYSTAVRVITDNSEVIKTAALETSLRLFAEGGTFLNNVANRIAFKATQSDGKPFNIRGVIKDNKNKFIDSAIAMHDGMGSFEFFPAENENYYLEWKDVNGKLQATPFPLATSHGIALQVRQQKNQLWYSVQNPSPSGEYDELYIIATSGKDLIYSAKTNAGNIRNPFGTIPTTALATGIVQVTVFNNLMQPLAERIVFVNNNNYQSNATIDVIESSVDKRGKNTIVIKSADTLQQTLSISVSDANLVTAKNRSIYSDMLLGAGVKGNVYQADQYFGETAEKNKSFLDLVMLTNGWRRYNWNAQVRSNKKNPEDQYISFTGVVTDNNDKIIPNANVSLIIRTKDTANRTFIATADENGFFKQDDLIFNDTATLYFGVTKTKAVKQRVEITPSINLNYVPLIFKDRMDTSFEAESITSRMQMLTKTYTTGVERNNADKRTKQLQEVKVEIKKKSPLDMMDDKYAKLYKGNRGGRSFDIMNDQVAQNSPDLMNYLIRWRLPRIQYGRLALYVDERRVLPMFLQNLRMPDIAYVKYVPNDFTEPFASGLYIYLKTDEDLIAENEKRYNTKLKQVKLAGYSPVKEFYHDDYSIADNRNNKRTDIQTTVFWKPDIVTDNSNKSFRFTFYNNDISDRLKVVVEGLNEDGKLVRIERILE